MLLAIMAVGQRDKESSTQITAVVSMLWMNVSKDGELWPSAGDQHAVSKHQREIKSIHLLLHVDSGLGILAEM